MHFALLQIIAVLRV